MRNALAFLVIIACMVGLPLAGYAGDLNINIGITPPPPPPPEPQVMVDATIDINLPALVFDEPPQVVVVPSGRGYVYMAPNAFGVYFYGGYWYRVYDGHWYRASIYNGPWDYIDSLVVPRIVLGVPPEYIFYMPPGYQRIHYHDLSNNWRTWDKRRHWDKYGWFKNELREETRRARFNRIEREKDIHREMRGDLHRSGPKRDFMGILEKEDKKRDIKRHLEQPDHRDHREPPMPPRKPPRHENNPMKQRPISGDDR